MDVRLRYAQCARVSRQAFRRQISTLFRVENMEEHKKNPDNPITRSQLVCDVDVCALYAD